MTPAKRRTLLLTAVVMLLVVGLGYRHLVSRYDSDPVTPVRPVAVPVKADTSAQSAGAQAGAVPASPVAPAGSRKPQNAAATRVRPRAGEPDGEADEEKPATELPKPAACDQLVLRDGDVLDVRVTEVGIREVRYKRCGRPEGPDYVVLRQDVLSIKYPNGSVDRFTP